MSPTLLVGQRFRAIPTANPVYMENGCGSKTLTDRKCLLTTSNITIYYIKYGKYSIVRFGLNALSSILSLSLSFSPISLSNLFPLFLSNLSPHHSLDQTPREPFGNHQVTSIINSAASSLRSTGFRDRGLMGCGPLPRDPRGCRAGGIGPVLGSWFRLGDGLVGTQVPIMIPNDPTVVCKRNMCDH